MFWKGDDLDLPSEDKQSKASRRKKQLYYIAFAMTSLIHVFYFIKGGKLSNASVRITFVRVGFYRISYIITLGLNE